MAMCMYYRPGSIGAIIEMRLCRILVEMIRYLGIGIGEHYREKAGREWGSLQSF